MAAAALVVAGALAVAGCGPKTSAAIAKATASPTSSAVKQGKQDAKALFAHCIPASAAGQAALLTSSTARQNVMQCAGVPKGERKVAAECVLTAVENGGKPPKGRQNEELWLLNAAYPCVQKYQGSAK